MRDYLNTINQQLNKNYNTLKQPPCKYHMDASEEIFYSNGFLRELFQGNYKSLVKILKANSYEDVVRIVLVKACERYNVSYKIDTLLDDATLLEIASKYATIKGLELSSKQLLEFMQMTISGQLATMTLPYNSIKTIIDIKDEYLNINNIVDFSDDYSLDKSFDKLENMIIMFRHPNNRYSELSIYVDVNEVEDCLKINGVTYNTVCRISVFQGKDTFGEFIYIKELNKFIYVNKKYCDCGDNCDNCPSVDFNYSDGDIIKMCKISKKKLELGHCMFECIKPFKVLALVSYVWEMYSNRKTITRSNSPSKKKYDKGAKISVLTNEFENITDSEIQNTEKTMIKEIEFKVVNLDKMYRYERKAWQGGHHKPPVEHIRKGHTRRIYNKDGSLKDIVEVKPTIVNEGKGQDKATTVKMFKVGLLDNN